MPVPHRRLCRCRMGKPFGAEFNVATVRRRNSLCQIGQTVAGIVNIPKRKKPTNRVARVRPGQAAG